MFNKNSVTMIILAAALMVATSANAREASEGPRGADNPADVAEAGHRHGRGADDGLDHIRHGRGADDQPGHIRHGHGEDDAPGTGGTAGGANDDGTPDQGPGDK